MSAVFPDTVQQQCVIAFKQGDHNEAKRLLPGMQQLQNVVTEFVLPGNPDKTRTVTYVTLLHLAAYHGWLDIIRTMKEYFKHNCTDSIGGTPLHYAAAGGSLAMIDYLITELDLNATIPNNNDTLPLHFTCFYGHLDATKYFIIKKYCDPNSRGQDGKTPLHYASKGGHMNMVRYLIQFNDILTTPDTNGALPLHIACLNGHLDLTKYFITEQKCDPNSEGQHGSIPLHYVCQGGHMNIIQYLITEIGCNPTTLNNDGALPLHIACRNGHLEATKYFVNEQNCDPNSIDHFGNAPLHYASQGGHINILRYLITEKVCDPNTPNSDGTLPLHTACLYGHFDAAKHLIITQKCDPNRQDQNGWKLLHYASQGGHMNIIKFLITELGCDPTTPNSDGALPLHISCLNGHLNVARYFINEQNCDPNSRGQHGSSLLHYASQGGHMNIIQYLITEEGCDPTTPNINDTLPLHIACYSGDLNTTKFFITEKNCDSECRGQHGCTPLHYASQGGRMNIIQYLITERGCDLTTPNSNGTLPLHIACLHGHINLTKYFITEQNCDPNSRDKHGMTPLHYASQGGHTNIIQYLITELGCDHTIINNDSALPLHIACLNGNLNVIKFFITEQKCDLKCRGQYGWTPLHYACRGGHMNIMQYLITELDCDQSIVDEFGGTILYLASYYGHIHIVQWLLHSGKVNLMAKDNLWRTCVDIAGHVKNQFELLKLLRPFIKATISFPIHTFSKTVLTGNSGAGKTTLAKVINERAKSHFNRLRFGNAEQVVAHSAGIVPSLVDSWEIGKMVIYDLAGHTEYHSSHFAVMEIVMQQSPATFINVIDLNITDTEIAKQLHYWLNFIDNATCKTSIKSCVIVVGSHADLLTNEQLKTKSNFIKDLIQKRPKNYDFVGLVAVDCRKIDSVSIRELISLLSKSHKIISARAPSISYYCHLLYAFLKSKQDMSTCTLQEIISAIACYEDSPLSSEANILSELLVALNDKGIIIFIQNEQQPEKSWVVVDTEKILEEINGILFAPKGFKVHRKIASSTGIVLTSSLNQIFPQYDLEMLIDLLQGIELCHRVNLSGNTTNLQSIETSSPAAGDIKYFLFFPSLMDCCRPNNLPSEGKLCFGWTIAIKNSQYRSFTSRFLHVLLLRLAYTYPLADVDHSEMTSHCSSSKCIVWTNGITWENEEGIRTLVELIDYNQRVVVAMSHKTDSRPVECSKHRSTVIRLVLDLKQQLCPNVEADEYLISPSLLNNWSAADWCVSPSDNDLFPIENVAKSMLLHKPYILSRANITSDHFATKDVLQFEPHYQLSPSSVCELMDSSKADEIVSHSLLREVKSRCQLNQLERQTHSSLKKCIDQFSIFAGRNPIVSHESDSYCNVQHSSLVLQAIAALDIVSVLQTASEGIAYKNNNVHVFLSTPITHQTVTLSLLFRCQSKV